MPFGAAVSQHPLATHAVGEVVGGVLEQVGPSPDMAVLFATGGYVGAMEDLASTVRSTLAPSIFIGCTAVSVLAGADEVEDRAAVALFAADWQGRLRLGPRGARAVRFDAQRDGDGWRLSGTDDVAVDDATLVLIADPFTFPVDGFLARLHHQAPGLSVVGGMASAARGPGGNRLVADHVISDHGAVGVFLPPGVPVRPVQSQGCRPIGEPLVVTAGRGNLVERIAGRPALDLINDLIESADHRDKSLMGLGLHLGLVANERLETFEAGDFLIRKVLGMERASRSVAVDCEVPLGTTVQFHVRDPQTADEHLRSSLSGHQGSAALVFTGQDRGEGLFGAPHHDAEVISEHVNRGATAGMFCSGEIGPVEAQSFLHSMSTSVLVFD
ncbi:MAG: FIST C-terminal domain-containing protein [Microthrixaceae bacterium]|jgi:small ligand-binding sensory domain FIST|nr:FIST C-terminal domain-containing protein [Microthrixaceae bacterium]